ncbi:MAG: hypothetical protein ACO3JL_00880 [Myxococcota bacterium]
MAADTPKQHGAQRFRHLRALRAAPPTRVPTILRASLLSQQGVYPCHVIPRTEQLGEQRHRGPDVAKESTVPFTEIV